MLGAQLHSPALELAFGSSIQPTSLADINALVATVGVGRAGAAPPLAT